MEERHAEARDFNSAHDVDHGINLEKAGATAVVPETSLQLAAAVLPQAKLPTPEIAATINEFRSRHLSELAEVINSARAQKEKGRVVINKYIYPLCSSLGYGFSRMMSKPKSQSSDSLDDNFLKEHWQCEVCIGISGKNCTLEMLMKNFYWGKFGKDY